MSEPVIATIGLYTLDLLPHNQTWRGARRQRRDAAEAALNSPGRAGLTYGAAFIAGAVLFFLNFAAIFNGSWTLLLLFLLCYAAAGAFAVRIGGVNPRRVALVLIVPAAPWVLWLFPASIPEAGVLRALLWPGLVVLMGGLGWLGGKAAALLGAR